MPTPIRPEITTPEALVEEEGAELSLRPQRLAEFIGQPKVKESMKIASFMGLIFGGIFALAAVFGASIGAAAGEDSALLGAVFGLGAVIVLPILYGGLGAVMALFTAWLYNVIAGFVGGIEVRTEAGPTA